MAAFLYDEERSTIEDLEKKMLKKINIKADPAYLHEKYTIYSA